MKFIMGFKEWWMGHAKIINRGVLVSIIVLDIYLAKLIYDPTTSLAQIIVKPSPMSTKEPEKVVMTLSPTPNPETSTIPTASPTNSPSPSSTADPTPTLTSTPTPIPTPTPTSTPTPIPTTPTPSPSPSPDSSVTSAVYITAYVYSNNQQLIAEQYPVKVVNTSTSEVIATAETGHDGKSPTWQIPANTSISVTLYPKPGFNGCGEVWNLTTGSLGTMESKSLSVSGDRSPCLTL